MTVDKIITEIRNRIAEREELLKEYCENSDSVKYDTFTARQVDVLEELEGLLKTIIKG